LKPNLSAHKKIENNPLPLFFYFEAFLMKACNPLKISSEVEGSLEFSYLQAKFSPLLPRKHTGP